MIKTYCGDCKWAIYDEKDEQVECKANRLQKYNELGLVDVLDDTDKGFTISTLCNMNRPLDFQGTVEDAEKENIPPVSLIIYFDKSIQNLQTTLDTLTFKPKKIVVINSKFEFNDEIINLLKPINCEYEIAMPLNTNYVHEEMDIAFKKIKMSYVYVINAGGSIPDNLNEKINFYTNKELKPLMLIQPSFPFGPYLFNALLYKFLSGNEPRYVEAEQKWDERKFLTRARKDFNNEPSIITWDQFNEVCNNSNN